MIIPVIIAAIALGRNFDIDTAATSLFIFDPKDIAEHEVSIPKNFVSSQYAFLESSGDVNNFLNIDGEIALKVKNGQFNVQGMGSYICSSVNRDNTVEMLIQVYHETVTKTFPSYIKQRPDWHRRSPEILGSHYIRSITYGGRLLISYQLHANRKEDMESIKAAVNSNLQVSGSLDLNVTGKLEKLSKEVADKASVTIATYSTTGSYQPPTTLQAVFDLVDAYPKLVKEVNNGLGAPLQLEIVPISTLKAGYKEYVKNKALNGILDEATDKYDDIQVTMEDYRNWIDDVELTDEQEQIVTEFERALKAAQSTMNHAITFLDGTKGPEQFDIAFRTYGEGPNNMPYKYSRWLLKLQHQIENKPFHWFPYTRAVTNYINWGNTTCSLPSTEPLYTGYAASSRGFGSGADLLCLPDSDPALDTKKLQNETDRSFISGVGYKLTETPGVLYCAFCRLENATSTFMITKTTECPEKSKREYDGYLMINKLGGMGSSFICVSKHPVDHLPNGDSSKLNENDAVFTRVLVPCPECENRSVDYVTCAICSR